MDWGELGIFAVIAVIVLLVLPVAWLYGRRRWLSRQTHAFDCSVRPTPNAHWVLGVARYVGAELQWFRVFSLSWRPARVFQQGEWLAVGSRQPTAEETPLLYETREILQLKREGEDIEVAVAPAGAMGLRSWLESAAPGAARYGASRPSAE